MHRFFRFIIPVLLVTVMAGCGATPGFTSSKDTTLPNAPDYTYTDTKGNVYSITTKKLIYDPVSEDNTIDGLDDEGRYLELNIELNDYAKMAAACERQLTTTQKELPANYTGYAIPTLTRTSAEDTEEINLSIKGVDELDYIIKPFLKDE
jgi:hypothetical protein